MSPSQTLDPKSLPRAEAERQRLAQSLHFEAREAFQQNQPLVASLKISDALMLYPNERAILDTFDEIALAQSDPLSLFPVSTGAVHVATAAGRARVLMMSNRLPEALELLGKVLAVAPTLGYLDWVRRWLAQPQIVAQLPWELLATSVVAPALRMVAGVSVPPRADDPRLPSVRAAAEIVRALLGRFAEEAALHAALAMALRRLGDPNATLAAADEGVRRFPNNWSLRTALLNAFGDAGRPDEALAQARVALQIDAEDFSPLNEAADAFMRANRPGEAVPLYQELLARDPSYPDVDACMHFARFKASPNADDHRALMYMRDRRPHSEHVQRMADEIEPPVPFVNTLPGPGDAAANYGREVVSELGHVFRCCGRGASISFTIRSKYPESPSAQLAFDLAMRAYGAESAKMLVEVERMPTPDPRADKGPVPMPIFALQNGVPRPLHSSADPHVQHAVGSIAYLPFRKDAWDPAAHQAAQQIGGAAAIAVLAVVTNPPPPPPDFDGITWMYRCQIAAALILSHMGPWDSGPARGALYSLVSGPSDWASSAAIVALAWRAGDSEAIRGEVIGAFQWLRSIIPAEGFTPWEEALARSWLAMGRHADNEIADLTAWIETYDRTVESKNEVETQRRYGGFTIEEYAWFTLERDRVAEYDYGMGPASRAAFTPPAALVQLCQKMNLDPSRPYVAEWQEALNGSPALMEEFLDVKQRIEFERMGVSGDEKAALDQIRDGRMDMHQRMAQAQQAQQSAQRDGDPDPVVFPGQPVAKLSDYVRIMKGMQTGNMQGALAPYGLDMMSYGSVAQAWGAKMAADAVLTEKFSKMMG